MTALPPMSVAGRLDALRAGFDGFDALVVTTLPNVRYLTGFTGSAGVLVVTAAGALLTTDGRYRTQSAEQVAAAGADVEITIGGMADQRRAVTDFLSASPRVGLEADNVTWSGQRVWADSLTRPPSWCRPPTPSRPCARSRTRPRSPAWSGPPPSPTPPSTRCCPLMSQG